MKIMVCWNRMKIKGDITLYSLLRKLRSGFQMLSHIEWVPAYGSHISAVSVLGIVGLVVAVRDGRMGNLMFISDKGDTQEKLSFVPGLRNLGNNCFLNVVLQSLASCLSFQHFLEELEETQLSSDGGQIEDLPLLVSLAALLEDLSTLKKRSVTLNPRKVMSAMQHYLPQFHLTNQQDAAEAFLHLLSCLRDELSESYMPSCGSLADVAAPPSRILSFTGIKNINDPERWRQQYFGPFDGILGSFLSCRSCSSEIMMDFCFFHTLPLSLTANTGASFLHRLTLEDCIKKFLAPEHVENYCCSHCWHISAIKYLSSVGGHQEEIRRLSSCGEEDGCNCRNISSLEAFNWSNQFSHTFKQLSIAHCPQILCLHLQRTSMNMLGV
uniref:ubiquitinyl hydrolase 1 n=1 Tax=Opuntia streptacantha TaxID=393608 RepID=A0A7C9ES80_OPUST